LFLSVYSVKSAYSASGFKKYAALGVSLAFPGWPVFGTKY
jgi:hypothetical protein